jgi:DNA-directed RNA polymerase subunit RPC12/RpoP
MEFFRHCPQCGRRFHIKLETKKLVTSHQESIPKWEPVTMESGGYGGSITPLEVQDGKPILVDVAEFQYAYKCKHCGHEWSERHMEERREG